MNSAAALTGARIRRISADAEACDTSDILAVEEPLEIRLQFSGERKHHAISITMRTPGADLELAAGFLFTEGILNDPAQISRIRHCGPAGNMNGSEGAAGIIKLPQNTVVVELIPGVDVDLKRLERNFYTTSSCGVCGKSSIEALHTGVKKAANTDLPKIAAGRLHKLPETLRPAQNVFDKTGGLHASALFNLEGELDIVREDVGRHNALDKVIGAKFLTGETPLSEKILLVSGRASFELVQKALMAGIPILAAVGAPSSLAVELAAEYEMTLIGFLRDGRFNVYTGGSRIIEAQTIKGK